VDKFKDQKFVQKILGSRVHKKWGYCSVRKRDKTIYREKVTKIKYKGHLGEGKTYRENWKRDGEKVVHPL